MNPSQEYTYQNDLAPKLSVEYLIDQNVYRINYGQGNDEFATIDVVSSYESFVAALILRSQSVLIANPKLADGVTLTKYLKTFKAWFDATHQSVAQTSNQPDLMSHPQQPTVLPTPSW